MSRPASLFTSPALPSAPVVPGELHFTSGGKRVRLTVFRPEAKGPQPTVLVLHGATGLDSANRYVRQVAEAWAAQGFATLLVHYFDRTGTTYASDSLIMKEFDRWIGTIGDAIAFALEQEFVDSARLGLVGYSLGGYLTMAQTVRDARVRAAVEIAGGVDAFSAQAATEKGASLSPVLLVHGEADQRVPFTEALKIQELLRGLNSPHETRFYPGEGHLLSPTAAIDAMDAGVEFLRARMS